MEMKVIGAVHENSLEPAFRNHESCFIQNYSTLHSILFESLFKVIRLSFQFYSNLLSISFVFHSISIRGFVQFLSKLYSISFEITLNIIRFSLNFHSDLIQFYSQLRSIRFVFHSNSFGFLFNFDRIK